ncbi:7608_t:CDS:2 [Entrophospora sp. SA101]|nr:13424_t:CDS:2 [Entrophospora sp. SA101]CAJ0845557.1 7608_t:CDS:2 [Entrophospora sp. SA101]
MEKLNEERIILNVGGIKYETYRSTLIAFPETLLGTMFQERNNELLNSTNNNNESNKDEYFFDRNGKAFHYIMEWYRNGGEIIWHNHDGATVATEEGKNDDEFEISGYGIINNYLSSIIGLLLGGDENNDNEDNKNSNNKSIDEILMVRSDDLTPVEEKYIQLNVYLNYDYDKIFENIKKFSLD